MATVILSAAGAALGGSVGGSVLGLSMAAVGRFAGAVIGRSIDQRVMGQGSDTLQTGRVSRLRLTGTGEGDAIAQLYGRMRVAGQVIWATEFKESSSTSGGGGKGGPSAPRVTQYSYSVSVAIALCEGEIANIGRIWADGIEYARGDLTMRVYTGSRTQLPDPKIEAVEGAGTVPAYRGTAYVVIEDLDLTPFGNRVPQFSFEVSRPTQRDQPGAETDPMHAIRGLALLPGSGEYALATSPAIIQIEGGALKPANINSPSGQSDFLTSLEQARGAMAGYGASSLIVSWFGDDLRASHCTIRPKIEQAEFDADNMPWQVAGLTRESALLVPRDEDDRPVYGGTPTDQSVIEAIQALKDAGQDVMYYPFILMEQLAGNGLPDPYSDATDQPVLPWRGRITTSIASGRDGSPDGTAAAKAEVAAFFGTASASDFTWDPDELELEETPFVAPISEGWGRQDWPPVATTGAGLLGAPGQIISPIGYTGPDEWSYRRFILHQAALCAAAGGVESFCIGSEMRGLTQIRGENNSFPAVAALIDLAGEVRSILGPDTKISYAADWSEYFGYQPQDGSGDRFFHLDPLWAHQTIDFIGIDNYMPLSDWRDGDDHLDARAGYDAIYSLDYLQSNIEGGEGYDWYYNSHNARATQSRTPINDDNHDEAWIWRYKDIRNWWQNPHHERIGGIRLETATAWLPRSKPIRFTEYGCPAVDRGTNQPNKFIDPKSSESTLPYFSSGQRDELIQHQYLRAFLGYWAQPGKNPKSDVYDGTMLDMEHAYVWTWDMRPYPFFPNNRALWSDGDNYSLGHWLNGRVSARSLASVIQEICARTGLEHCDTSAVYGLVRGYTVDQVSEARSALQPLMLRYGVDAIDRNGRLHFLMRDGLQASALDPDALVRDPEMDGIVEQTRSSHAELAGRVRLRFVEADGDFEVISEEAILPDDTTHAVSSSEFPLVMTRAEGRETLERWLSEARVATDTLRLTLPPSHLPTGAGDVIELPAGTGETSRAGLFRIDRVDQLGGAQKLEAVRIEPESYRAAVIEEDAATLRPFTPPAPVTPFFLDLPLLTGSELPHAPHIAVTATPWPGSVAVYSSDENANFALNKIIAARAPVGVLETALDPARAGVIDRGTPVQVRMFNGALESVSDAGLLNGGNLCAIGDGTPDGWELIQFRDAHLVDANTYQLSQRLRGQMGTERGAEWPEGSYLVRLDGSAEQIDLAEGKRGLARFYRIGPATRPLDDPSYRAARLAFEGVGLRPLSPVHLRLTGQAGGDLLLNWIRRTRIDGDGWEAPEVPLGEEREAYLVRVLQDNTLLREVETETPNWTYSVAQQVQDGLGGSYQIAVAQISARFGPGRFASVTVSA